MVWCAGEIYLKFHTSCHFTAAEAMVQEDTALVVASIQSRTTLHWEKKESQNGSPRRAIWLSVTQLSMELHYQEKKWLSPTKESRFSKLLSKRAILALFFFSVCTLCGQHTVQDDPGLFVARIWSKTTLDSLWPAYNTVQDDSALSIWSSRTLHLLWPAYSPGRPCARCGQHTVSEDPVLFVVTNDSNQIKTPIDRVRAIIRIRPLITDTQTNTLDW